jgi:N-acetyl-beta-hexosaminidase
MAVRPDLLIPVQRITVRGGCFRWPAKPLIASPRLADTVPLQQLRAELRRQGLKGRIVHATVGPASIRIERQPGISHSEGYTLKVDATGVRLGVRSDAGAYYAVQTLITLIRQYGDELPHLSIDDSPDFDRRAVYLDISRGKVPTVDTLKQHIERLAHCKINEVQL